jgi:hypothetical protein
MAKPIHWPDVLSIGGGTRQRHTKSPTTTTHGGTDVGYGTDGRCLRLRLPVTSHHAVRPPGAAEDRSRTAAAGREGAVASGRKLSLGRRHWGAGLDRTVVLGPAPAPWCNAMQHRLSPSRLGTTLGLG